MNLKGVGYCMNSRCDYRYKGEFIYNPTSEAFFCKFCRDQGHMMLEAGVVEGKGVAFKEARVEFNYDPMIKRYKGLAIITDNSLTDSDKVYIYSTPTLRTERSAVQRAEAILSWLRYNPNVKSGELVRITSICLSFDEDRKKFKSHLEDLREKWVNGK